MTLIRIYGNWFVSCLLLFVCWSLLQLLFVVVVVVVVAIVMRCCIVITWFLCVFCTLNLNFRFLWCEPLSTYVTKERRMRQKVRKDRKLPSAFQIRPITFFAHISEMFSHMFSNDSGYTRNQLHNLNISSKV